MEYQVIQSLTAWSSPREVTTKLGARMLSTGPTTELFWKAWREKKAELQSAGVSCGKDKKSGDWQACWWQPIPETTINDRKKNIESSMAADATIEVPAPAGLSYLPYQRAGISYAISRHSVLIGDEMGLGKTIQAIGIINADPSINRVLVVCPASLKLNWKRELKKWLVRPLSIGVVNGKWPSTDITIINFDLLKRDADACRLINWDMLIVDECHYTKNPKSQRSMYVWGKPTKGKPSEWDITPIPARRRVALTGTPLCNRPLELWPIVHGLRPDLWTNFWTFVKRYCDAHENSYGWDLTGASNLDELQERLRTDLMVRRLKSDVLTELPAKRRQIIELPANGAARTIEAERIAAEAAESRIVQLRRDAERAKSGTKEEYAAAVHALRRAHAAEFSEIAKLRHDTAVAKIPAVIEFVTDALESDGKILLFAHHHDVVDALAAEFSKLCVVVTGDTPIAKRLECVDAFQNDPAIRLFIGNIQAAGVGLTLTAGAHVIFAELPWTPGEVSQAEDRAHRIGQQQSVLVQHLVLEGSIDARMAQVIVEKQNILDKALDTDLDINSRYVDDQPVFSSPIAEAPAA